MGRSGLQEMPRHHQGVPFNARRKRNLKARLMEQQNHRCCHCGKRMSIDNEKDYPTFEHILPVSRGGSSRVENLAISCFACNHRRGSGNL